MKEKFWVGALYGILTVIFGIIGYGTIFTIPLNIENIKPIYIQTLFSLILTAILSTLWIYYYYEFIKNNRTANK